MRGVELIRSAYCVGGGCEPRTARGPFLGSVNRFVSRSETLSYSFFAEGFAGLLGAGLLSAGLLSDLVEAGLASAEAEVLLSVPDELAGAVSFLAASLYLSLR